MWCFHECKNTPGGPELMIPKIFGMLQQSKVKGFTIDEFINELSANMERFEKSLRKSQTLFLEGFNNEKDIQKKNLSNLNAIEKVIILWNVIEL